MRTRMRTRPNDDIRHYAKKKGVFLWEIAEAFSITDATQSRILRHELPPDEKRRYYEQIDKIAAKSRTDK